MKVSASIYSNKNLDIEIMAGDPSLANVDMWHIDCHNDLSVFEDISELRKFDRRPIDLHIITPTPEKFIPFVAKYEIEYVCFQYENIETDYAFEELKFSNLGIAILPNTELIRLKPFVKNCRFVLFMATVPGMSGGKFNAKIMERVEECKLFFPDKEIFLDGGINDQTMDLVRHLDPHSVVSGSYLFKHNDKELAVRTLKKN